MCEHGKRQEGLPFACAAIMIKEVKYNKQGKNMADLGSFA